MPAMSGRRARRRLGGEPELLENGAAGSALGDDGEDTLAAAAGVADQNIDSEHALEEVGPREPMANSGVGLIG